MLANHNLPIDIGDIVYWNNYNSFGNVIDFIALGYYKVVDFDQIHVWYQVVVKDNNNNLVYLTEHNEICAYSKADGNVIETLIMFKIELKAIDLLLDLKIGDIVVLKSGSPKMTIEDIGEYTYVQKALCTWFDGNKKKTVIYLN